MASTISSHDNPFHQFLDCLALSLDVGTKLRVYHVSTPPVPTTSIFSPASGRPDEATICESHFLTISQPHVITSASVDRTQSTNDHNLGKTGNQVLVLGIEVLVFSTDSLVTIFVSKADSTGFLSRPAKPGQGSSSIVKLVISAFLEWLVTRQLSFSASGSTDVTNHGLVAWDNDHVSNKFQRQGRSDLRGSSRRRKRLVLSLFARSQNQYLFPGSIENTTKHVLDDRQLIKWWCRVLDGLVQKDRSLQMSWKNGVNLGLGCSPAEAAAAGAPDLSSTSVKVSAKAYLVVPGFDRTETIRSFFPPSARCSQTEGQSKWHNSYPVNLLVQQNELSAEPSLPVRCLIPRLPDDPKARYCDDLDDAGVDEKGQWKDIRSLQQFWEMMEYRQECAAGRLVGFVWVVFDPVAEPERSEVASHADPGVRNTANRSETGAADNVVQVPPTIDPMPSSHGSVLVANEQYNTLSDLLINTTDFAGAELAIKSTCEWVEKVKEITGLQQFGIDIGGKKTRDTVVSGSASTSTHTPLTVGSKHGRDEGSARVTVLTGVRKKKQKVNTETPSTADDTTENGHGKTVMGLNNQTEKHDNKVDHTGNVNGNGVKTLSAGLIRKKPKAVQ